MSSVVQPVVPPYVQVCSPLTTVLSEFRQIRAVCAPLSVASEYTRKYVTEPATEARKTVPSS